MDVTYRIAHPLGPSRTTHRGKKSTLAGKLADKRGSVGIVMMHGVVWIPEEQMLGDDRPISENMISLLRTYCAHVSVLGNGLYIVIPPLKADYVVSLKIWWETLRRNNHRMVPTNPARHRNRTPQRSSTRHERRGKEQHTHHPRNNRTIRRSNQPHRRRNRKKLR